jgi:hypothetical protein
VETPMTTPTVTAAFVQEEGRQLTLVMMGRPGMQTSRREYLRLGLCVRLQADVVLVWRREDGDLEYYGVAEDLARISQLDPSAIPWTRLRLPTLPGYQA